MCGRRSLFLEDLSANSPRFVHLGEKLARIYEAIGRQPSFTSIATGGSRHGGTGLGNGEAPKESRALTSWCDTEEE